MQADVPACPLLRTIRPREFHVSFIDGLNDADAPRIAANLAILNERPTHVWLDVDFARFPTIRAGDGEVVIHAAPSYGAADRR